MPAADRDAALTALVACDIVSVLAPICPFACEELWHAALGREGSVYTAPWPEFDVSEAAADEVEIAVQVLGPICPFACEELWHAALGREGSVYTAPWPEFDVSEAAADEVEIAVQVLGKMRARVMVPAGADAQAMQAAAEAAVAKHLEGKTVVKAICIPGKLVNLVVK